MNKIIEKCYVTNLWDLEHLLREEIIGDEPFLNDQGIFDESLMWDSLIPWWKDKEGGIYWFTASVLKNALITFSDDERTVKVILGILELMDKEELPKGFLCLV